MVPARSSRHGLSCFRHLCQSQAEIPLIPAVQISRASSLINTARATLVDEDAVRAALDEGRLQAYATDVFTTEPPAPGSLASHPRVIATSHIGGLTDESVGKATKIAVANLLSALVEETA
ncbi:NAD(P)-dependent oxidoreductase [Sinorhizobium medicae]|nr:NAD(P)-dependent oxidoreductase [Sinorhizobium medicae]WQO91354.1 NAD(P)-dependent oxidoreductase [Sinorhizobium medicae]